MSEVRRRVSFLECAEELVSENLIQVSRSLSSGENSKKKTDRLIKILIALPWSKLLIKKIGSSRISSLMARLKRAEHSDFLLDYFRSIIMRIWGESAQPWDARRKIWRDLIIKHDLITLAPLHEWGLVVDLLDHFRIFSPEDFLLINRGDINQFSENDEKTDLIFALWSKIRFSSSKEIQNISYDGNNDFKENAFLLADLISADSVKNTELAERFALINKQFDLSEGSSSLGPAAKIRKIALASDDSKRIADLCSKGSQLNTLLQVNYSLKAVASGLRRWGMFCESLREPHFPPTAKRVSQWSFMFPPGKTFGLYVAHLLKACQLLGISDQWCSHEVRGIIKGLKNAKVPSMAPKSAISPAILAAIVKKEGFGSEFAQLALISYAFLLRVFSEALPLTRAVHSGDLDEFSDLEGPPIIGMLRGADSEKLTIKFRRRKNINKCGVIKRGCCCETSSSDRLSIHIPSLFCPVCSIWPSLRKRVKKGEQLFPNLAKSNINRILRAVLRKIGIQRADSFGTHAFRRGAARALLDNGGTMADLLRSGMWSSSAFKLYLDMDIHEDKAMSNILIEISDSE